MEKINEHKNVLSLGWVLAVSALLGTGLMSIVNWHSEPYIAENERKQLLRSLNAVIPKTSYSNDILQDNIEVLDPKLLGSYKPSIGYRARNNGAPVAIALTVVAPNGYSGPIKSLVGIDHTGKITAVRVIKHKETPGLGDAIEKQRSNWIDGFIGKSLNNPAEKGWKVKRDGGEFDQLTGATITPRAIVRSVHEALQYFDLNHEKLFTEQIPALSEQIKSGN